MIRSSVPALLLLFAPFAACAAPVEKDYEDATVVLLDHDTGMIGVTLETPSGQTEKKSFQVDPKNVYVTNPLNHNLDWSQVQVGDHIDIYAVIGEDGRETVADIIDYNRFDPDS